MAANVRLELHNTDLMRFRLPSNLISPPFIYCSGITNTFFTGYLQGQNRCAALSNIPITDEKLNQNIKTSF